MSDSNAPSRRPLWPVFVMPALLVVAAAAWSGFWFYTSAKVDQSVDAWRAREAASGRVFDCGKRSVAGFPFRLEVRCHDAAVALVSQSAGHGREPLTATLPEILVVAQIYDPRLLIAEFSGPAAIAGRDHASSLAVTWTTARASLAGLPHAPQRVALVFDAPAIDRVDGATRSPLARAAHVELHGRFTDDSTPAHPIVEAAAQLSGASLQELHPLLATAFDAEARARITGLKDARPKPWPQRFREIANANGRIEIVQSRISQGDVTAVATGALRLTATGHLDGDLQVTAVNLDRVVPALGIDKMLEQGVSQRQVDKVAPGLRAKDVNAVLGALDRVAPGLADAARKSANVGAAAALNALGQPAELDGKPARAFPLRFVDGAVLLGPIKVGQTPPLF